MNQKIASELVDMAERIAQEAKGLIGKNNDKDYKFYTVVKDKIEGGWEYKDDAKDNIDEMKEEGIRGKILSITGLERKGIDPNDDKNWTSGSRIAAGEEMNNPRNWSDDEIREYFDSNPNLRMQHLARMTGKSMRELHRILMPD